MSYTDSVNAVEGLLLVDKPEGWTSFDVVHYVRNIVARLSNKKPKNTKVGHTGTLDPAATGLLVLCIGSYTKRVPELIKQDKLYEVEMTLGKTSTTADKEGDITTTSSDKPEKSEVEAAVMSFIGNITQVPPAYSAVKVNGKRAYELARQGKTVQLEPRSVTIHALTDITYEYPIVRFRAHVGSGTYIRSLVEDIGQKLGCGAYMSGLRRLQVGEFNITDAVQPQALSEENLQKTLVIKS